MKQTFGLNQINTTTPLWAKWFFRIVFLFNKIIIGYIAATNLISPEARYEITLFLTLVIDPLAFGFSKMFGIKVEDEEKMEIYADDIGGGGQQNPSKTKPTD
jgi:hypothetical protein